MGSLWDMDVEQGRGPYLATLNKTTWLECVCIGGWRGEHHTCFEGLL